MDPEMNGPGQRPPPGPPRGQRPPWPYPPPPPARRSGGFGCSGCAIAGLAVALVLSLLLNMVLSASAAAGVSADGMHQEKLYSGDLMTPDKIALITVKGAIMEGGWPATDPVEEVRSQLKIVANDPNVKGVLLRVDSPGGGVTASDQIYNMLRQVKVPIFVSMGSMAASGGYYIAAAGEQIFAERTTITGSIGVLITSYNVSGLMEEWKIQDVTQASGGNKELLSMTKPVQEEHHKIIQDLVDAMYERFLDVVMEGRTAAGLTRPALREIADGRIMLGQQAVDHKLVDKIGYLDDALAALQTHLSLSSCKVVQFEKLDPFGGLFGASGPQNVRIDIDKRQIVESFGPKALALWKP